MARIVVQQVKPLLATPAFHIRTKVCVPDALLPIHLPANNVPGKGEKDGPSMWAPAIYVGDLDGVLGSWLQLSLC